MFLLKILVCFIFIPIDEIASENSNQIDNKTLRSNQIDADSGRRNDEPEDVVIQEPMLYRLEEVKNGGPRRKLYPESRYLGGRRRKHRRKEKTTTDSATRGYRGGRNSHMGRLPRRRRYGGWNSGDAPPTCKKSYNVYLALIPFWICVLLFDNA